MPDCSTCLRSTAEDNIRRMELGKETLCENLYYLPDKATQPHENFVKSMDQGRWGFILVRGDNGAGKTVYVKHLERIAREKEYCVAHIELMGDEIRDYGIPGFMVYQSLHKLRLPDGYQLLPKIKDDEQFKKKVYATLEHDRSILEFWSDPLTTVLRHFTSPQSAPDLKDLANEWLHGSRLYVRDLRLLGIYNPKMRSFLDVPVKDTLYFVKQLCQSLGYKGLLIAADEIEKGGDLYPVTGRMFLDSLRDAINILLDTEASPTKISVQEGLFICFAISVPYLFWSGLISSEDLKTRGIERPAIPPRTRIDLSPRLHTILEHCASTVDVDIDDPAGTEEIIIRIIPCYNRAKNASKSIDSKVLASNTIKRAGGYLPRSNIQLTISFLDGKWSY